MNVIIVGAGIAGLSAGITLRRAGHKVTILEQSSLLHETGAAVTIGPNASRVLRSWDFSPAKSQMVAMDKGGIFNGMTMDVLVPNYYANLEETYGFPVYSAHRVDLHNQLRGLATQHEGIANPVEIQVRAKVVDYDAARGQVTLEDGRVLQSDLVVAADGVHSIAVGHVLGEKQSRARDTGWATLRWLVPTEDLLADPKTSALAKEGVQGYFTGAQGDGGLVWYPCRDNEVQNFLYLSQAFHSPDASEDYRTTVDSSVPLEYARKDFGPALQAVVEKARDVKYWKLVARDPLPMWHKDKLVLIGDSAHPMLPFQAQGGGQAIEDGAALGVLFDQLKDRDEIEARLQQFEQVRKNRGSSLQVLSNSSHPQPQSVRDAASKYLPDGKELNDSADVNDYIFSFDVIRECEALVA